MKYTAKDSVFSFIFRQPENTRQLYLALHPEDKDVTEADCKLITLEHVLTNGMTNDLGFQVRDMLILLVEAQTKFSINIALRIMMYLAATYKEYVDEHKLDLYGSKPVSIPRPELYMIYTGALRKLPEIIRLSDMYGGNGDAEIKIHVLQSSGTNNIVDQYIRFCEISDEQRNLYGYTMKAVEETLRICCKENILMPFLASRQKEVRDIMVTLFDQKRVTEIHEYNLVKDARREGLEEGQAVGISALVSTLKKFSVEKPTVVQELVNSFGLTQQEAEEKVEQYWGS